MPRKRKDRDSRTPLSLWLDEVIAARGITVKNLASIAELAPSVIQAYRTGSWPAAGSMPGVRKLANHFGYSLAQVLTGAADTREVSLTSGVTLSPSGNGMFSGLARITIHDLVPGPVGS